MLIRVLEIAPSTGAFCFGGGNPQTWIEVDWFRDDPSPDPDDNYPTMDTEEGREQIKNFIMSKRYFDSGKPYLVLHEKASFTIGYRAP